MYFLFIPMGIFQGLSITCYVVLVELLYTCATLIHVELLSVLIASTCRKNRKGKEEEEEEEEDWLQVAACLPD